MSTIEDIQNDARNDRIYEKLHRQLSTIPSKDLVDFIFDNISWETIIEFVGEES